MEYEQFAVSGKLDRTSLTKVSFQIDQKRIMIVIFPGLTLSKIIFLLSQPTNWKLS